MGRLSNENDLRPIPFKHNASRRHWIPEMKFKVTNRAEYEEGLRRRGSLTFWVTPEALASLFPLLAGEMP